MSAAKKINSENFERSMTLKELSKLTGKTVRELKNYIKKGMKAYRTSREIEAKLSDYEKFREQRIYNG